MDEEKAPESPVEPEQVAEPDHEQPAASLNDFVPPLKPKHFFRSFLKFLLILIIIAAIVGGVIWFLGRDKTASKATTTAKTPTTATTSTQNSSVTKITSSTKHYDSSNYNLGFDYPADWTVNDQASAKLTATSPVLQLAGVNGVTFSGEIVFTIQNKQTSITAFAQNSAVASLESQKIAYKKPTPNQRAQTYVTFVDYDGTVGFIDALYITGDNGYQVAQNVPVADVIQADPLVTISFLKCADTTCKAAPTAVSILAKTWSDTAVSTPLLNLLKSLTIE
jgi:hypothetical protein